MGGAKCVWKVITTAVGGDEEEETVIFKSHKVARFFKREFWDRNGRDAMISGGMGNDSMMMRRTRQTTKGSDEYGGWNHILPMYHYCALANVVPYARDGNLMEYVRNHREDEGAQEDDRFVYRRGRRPALKHLDSVPSSLDGKSNEDDENVRQGPKRGGKKGRRRRIFGPVDTLRMALQAARGLYQAQLHRGGRPTFVHADLNPSQFLVFALDGKGGENDEDAREEGGGGGLPLLQINDFNQGRFLTRSLLTNVTCPFRSCSKNHRGNRYHTPERFSPTCVDQDERIDTFALGGVFFFLLTDGLDPYVDKRNYADAIKRGEIPNVPRSLQDGDDNGKRHPAYAALEEVMERCMAFKLEDRPSSLEVVRMLEERLERVA